VICAGSQQNIIICGAIRDVNYVIDREVVNMAKLIIKLPKKKAQRMKRHLEKEHPTTRGKMSIRK
jgi:hypothetical protein